jgi:peptide/nickel transport system ATP-binding protein
MGSIPRLGLMRGEETTTGERLQEIVGTVPPLNDLPPGCHFAPRCPMADERCRAEYPPYVEHLPGHWAACWYAGKTKGEARG